MTNTLFPGRRNYTGPKSGPFSLLHHGKLWEWSHDVTERTDYIRREKLKHERATRLYNIMHLGGCAAFKDKAYAARDKAYAAWIKACAARDKAYAARDKADAAWIKACAARDKADAAWIKACAARDKADAAWVKAHPNADAEILAYITTHIPDCAWNGTELVFTAAIAKARGET